MKPHTVGGTPCATKTNISIFGGVSLLAAATMLFVCSSSRAVITGPYMADTNTLHLWHLDETTVPAVDSAPGGTNMTVLTNLATLGNASLAGFGTALNTGSSNRAYLAPRLLLNGTGDEIPIVYANTNSGAFTFEAVVRVDFDPTVNFGNRQFTFFAGEGDSSGPSTRPFQFRMLPVGSSGGGSTTEVRLHFFNSAAGGLVSTVPTSGPDAIVQGNWYHVAATFDGAAAGGHILLYWTLMDSTRIQANLIGSGTMINLNPIGFGTNDWCIANQGRSDPTAAWNGLIDEIRISKVVRSATEMMFNSALPFVAVQPVGSTNAIGQPFTLSATGGGLPPLGYQWRLAGTNIPGATATSYSVASAQFADAGDYDVVVTNASPTAATSIVATVVVRIPTNLTWIGSATTDWEISAINWDSDTDTIADSVYAGGDNVVFNNAGAGAPVVNLPSFVNPSSVTVAGDTDYLLTTLSGGKIVGNASFTKQGNNRAVLDTDNTYTGPTTISSGILQIGNNATRGSLGSGPVTNLGTLNYSRTDGLTMANSIAGSGTLIKDQTGSFVLLGTNTMTGPIIINRGNVTLGAAALGGVTNITANGNGAGNGSSLSLANVTVGPSVTYTGITSLPDNRAYILADSGTNIWNGAVVIDGVASAGFSAAGGTLEVNGPVSGPTYVDYFTLRGSVTNGNIIRGTINLPMGLVQKTDGNTWVVGGTNSYYLVLRMLGGIIKLGNDDSLATNCFINCAQGVSFLDLAGFNQTVSGLSNSTALGVITNSSTTSDSRLTVATANTWVFGSQLANAASGPTRKLALTLNGGGLTLTNTANTYSGDTTIIAGTLGLAVGGAIPKTSPIAISGGATLDVTARNDATLTLNPGQVLTGNGTVVGNVAGTGTVSPGSSIGVLNVTGNVTLGGATINEVSLTGGTNDQLNVTGSLIYGGTLAVTNIGGSAFSVLQTFKLFNAASYAGSFSSISPSAPAFGLKWDTSTLTTDGTLRIATIPTNPTNITASVLGGNTLQVDWPADHTGWTLQMQTNAVSAGISTNWFNVPGSAFTNQVFVPFNPSVCSAFFRMVYP